MYRYAAGFAVVVVLVAVSACTKANFHPVNPSISYSPTEQVRVFRNYPDTAYYEIGTIRVVGPDKDKLAERVREEARKVGAQAVVVKPAAVRSNAYTSQQQGTRFAKVEYIMEAVALRFGKP